MKKESKKVMKTNVPSLDALVYQALTKHSDPSHLLSMTDLRSFCDLAGHPADRRTIYKSIDMLKEAGVEIIFVRKNGKQGYYLKHLFTNAEALFLMNACKESSALSSQETDELVDKIRQTLPEQKISQIPPLSSNPSKTQNHRILEDAEKLFPAIAHNYYVEFLYFDITVTKKKKYRKDSTPYRLVPYAVISENGRYYVVFYSDKHQNFGNYRLDKMDQITVTNEHGEGVPFSLDDHLRNSFQMYHSSPQTVTAVFDNSLSSIVFDQFGDNIVISSVDEKTFTASIRTAVTPPLVSWFLQFYDKVVIKKPKTLIEEYQRIAKALQNTYPEDK
jgi:predicted DNA-binding transcriptional regulator YafY